MSTDYRDDEGRTNVILVTVRIEVPVLFPFPADAEERGVTWDELNETAISAVCDILPPSFTREAVEEMVALRGPGSSGHYIGQSAEDKVAEPHLTAEFPAAHVEVEA
jgi:hypothetical protein